MNNSGLHLIVRVVSALATSLGFCFVYNVRGRVFGAAAWSGVLTWLFYELAAMATDNLYLPYFVGAAALSIYAEVMSRVKKAPATVFLIIGLLPLVPGGGIYQTMLAFMEGDSALFSKRLIETLGISGTLALALMIVSSFARFFQVAGMRHEKLSRRL